MSILYTEQLTIVSPGFNILETPICNTATTTF